MTNYALPRGRRSKARALGTPTANLGIRDLALVTLFLVSACAGGGLASEQGWSAPIVLDGTLYLGNRDGQVLSFEAARLDNGFRTGAQPVNLDEPDAPEHYEAFKELFQAIDDEGENSLGLLRHGFDRG